VHCPAGLGGALCGRVRHGPVLCGGAWQDKEAADFGRPATRVHHGAVLAAAWIGVAGRG
jgi:hypothetical protein